jgi:Flp pilus assembly pilin Flp
MVFPRSINNFHREESGQDLVEYALVLIAVATGALAGSSSLASDFQVWTASLKAKINSYLQ